MSQTNKMNPKVRYLLDEALAQLPEKLELVYVDQGDQFYDEQITHILDGDMEKLWESTSEWESDQQHSSMRLLLEDCTDSKDDADSIWDDVDAFEEWQSTCWERDQSEWFDQMLRNTPGIMVRYQTDHHIAPDSWSMDEEEVLEQMHGIAEAAGIDFEENKKELWSLVVEASYGGVLCVLHRSDLEDIMKVQDGGKVEFTDPMLLVYDGFNGSGCMEQVKGKVTIDITDDTMRHDTGRMSWSDGIAGIVHSCAETPANFIPNKKES